mgnify:CR=1 FL=1
MNKHKNDENLFSNHVRSLFHRTGICAGFAWRSSLVMTDLLADAFQQFKHVLAVEHDVDFMPFGFHGALAEGVQHLNLSLRGLDLLQDGLRKQVHGLL